MQKNDEKKGKNKSFAGGAVKGFITGVAIILIILAIAAALISSGRIPEGAMKGLVWGAAFCGALLGSVVSIKSHGAHVLAAGLTVGAAIFALTLIGAAFSEGGIVGRLTPGLLIALLGGSILGSLMCMRRKGRRRA